MKRIYSNFFILFILVFGQNVSAQISAQFQKVLGGINSDVPSSLIKTADGGYLIAGSSSSPISGDKSEGGFGFSDFWLVRLDSAGNKLWDKTLGGSNDDYGMAVVELPDGSIIIGGTSYSSASGNITSSNYGICDYLLVKTDSAGNKLWDFMIGGTYFDFLTDLTYTADGNILVTGFSNSTNTGLKSEYGNGGYDYWILKISQNHSIIWQNTIGGDEKEQTTKSHQLADGTFLIAGGSSTNYYADKMSASFGDLDYWVIRLDSAGSLIWQGTYGGDSTDIAMDATVDSTGGFIIAGESFSQASGNKTVPGFGGSDIWVVKTNTTGFPQFQNCWGNTDDDFFSNIIINGSDIWVMGSSSATVSGNKSVYPRGGMDPLIINSNLFLQGGAQSTFGGYHDDILKDVIPLNDGLMFLLQSNSGTEAEKSEPSKGGNDYWMLKGNMNTNFNKIKGNLAIDLDSSYSFSAADYPIAYHRVDILDFNAFSFTDYQGYYTIYSTDTGMLHFSGSPYFNYNYLPQPVVDSAYFSSIGIIDSSHLFLYYPVQAMDDLAIELIPIGPFRAGNSYQYIINYSNKGTTTIDPEIRLITDSHSNFSTANVVPTTVSGDTVNWALGPLAPFGSGQIIAKYSIPTSTPLNTLLYNKATILPILTDFYPFDNEETWEIRTTGSYDPNDITVNIDSIPDSLLLNPPYLDYIIRFQNTGNDTAFYVNVINRLPVSLLDSTLEVISSSHPMEIKYNPSNRLLEFTFEDIELPDSVHSEPESHGYIHYRIKPAGNLTLSDIIRNTAGIYFDYNPIVLTNIAKTVFYHPVSGVGLTEQMLFPVLVFPNPARELLHIRFDTRNPAATGCRITDLSGRIVNQTSITDARELTLSISELSEGTYFLETTYKGGWTSTCRFIVGTP